MLVFGAGGSFLGALGDLGGRFWKPGHTRDAGKCKPKNKSPILDGVILFKEYVGGFYPNKKPPTYSLNWLTPSKMFFLLE